MKKEHSGMRKNLLILLGVLLLAAGAALVVRWTIQLRDPAVLARFQEWIRSLGFGGWLLLLVIQYVQIVIAFIPGGPIQIVAGALFGPVGGLATCVLGMLLATATVFSLVNRYGHRVIRLFVKEKEVKEYKFLHDEKRLEHLVVVLFLIPGTPKDVLTYLFALTAIPLSRFMLLSTVARIPAALTSVLAGNSMINGEWGKTLILFAVLSAISLAGLALQKKVKGFYHRKKK